jgi:hypothetical protein
VVHVLTDLDHQDPIFDAVADRVGVLDTAVGGSDVNVVSHDRKSTTRADPMVRG